MRFHFLSSTVLTAMFILLSAGQAFAETDVEQKLRTTIEGHVPAGAVVTISKVRVIGKLPKGDFDLRLRDTRRIQSKVQAEVIPAKPTKKTTYVRAEIEVMVPVPVAAIPISEGDKARGATRMELRDMHDLPTGWVSDSIEFDGMVAKRAISEGAVLTTHLFESPVVIRRNDVVTFLVKRGPVQVTGRGIALQTGRDGQVIKIRNLQGESVLAAIARKGYVEVP